MKNKLEEYYHSPEYVNEVLETLSKIQEEVLPEELIIKAKERAEKEGRPYFDVIKEIIEAREALGYQSFKGYHTSSVELNLGDFLEPGEGEEGVCYSKTLDFLYGNKSAKWLYVIEGSNTDNLFNDEYGWYKTKGKRPLKIIAKIRLTPEVMQAIGGNFAALNTIN